MSRKKRPEWTTVTAHIPKRMRGFHCAGEWFTRRNEHYVKEGTVWRCDRCYGRTWVCSPHWEAHMNEHYMRELAQQQGGAVS